MAVNTLACGLALMATLGLPPEREAAVREVAKYNSPDLMVLAAVESGFRQEAVSSADAVGVLQLTFIAVKEVYAQGCLYPLPAKYDLHTLRDNALFGYCFYSYLTSLYKGDILEVLAHYNGGGYAVNRLRNFLSPPPETAQHIVKFLTLKRKVPECRSY